MRNQNTHYIRFRVTTRTFGYDTSLIKQAQVVMIPISIREVPGSKFYWNILL